MISIRRRSLGLQFIRRIQEDRPIDDLSNEDDDEGSDESERLGLVFRKGVEQRRGEHVARHASDRVEMQVARHGHAAAWKGTT